MKVQVKKYTAAEWRNHCIEISMEDLQKLCRSSVFIAGSSFPIILPVMEELDRRRSLIKPPSNRQTAARAFKEFQEYYMPEISPKLTPSPRGKECLGNGTWPGYECQCDECDEFLTCFPE